MRIWFDTEFIDNGFSIELLSIGMVREDGAEFYAEPLEAERARCGDWIKENVLPHLAGPTLPRACIADRVIEFAGQKPEFWADYGAYDWVALAQLYGPLMLRPDGWPMYYRDLRWLRAQITDLVVEYPAFIGTQHHALADARHCKARWEVLRGLLRR